MELFTTGWYNNIPFLLFPKKEVNPFFFAFVEDEVLGAVAEEGADEDPPPTSLLTDERRPGDGMVVVGFLAGPAGRGIEGSDS